MAADEHKVTTLDRLAELYPRQPAPASLHKEMSRIDDNYRALIEAAPFFTIATQSTRGLDCSPRGDDPKGGAPLVQVLDETRVAFADRRGNNRLNTLRNIIAHPHVALLFLIPGVDMTLRLNGRAHITNDPALLARFTMRDVEPATVIIVEVDTLFFQCARALARAELWNPAHHVDPSSLPSAGTLLAAGLQDFDGEAYDEALPARQAATLY